MSNRSPIVCDRQEDDSVFGSPGAADDVMLWLEEKGLWEQDPWEQDLYAFTVGFAIVSATLSLPIFFAVLWFT